jgi:hypothetical protein
MEEMMLKATSSGIIEFGKEIELTYEDRITILSAISVCSTMPTLQKIDGKWSQEATQEFSCGGYRIID